MFRLKSTRIQATLRQLTLGAALAIWGHSAVAQPADAQSDNSFLNAYEQGRSELLTAQGLELLNNDEFESAERIFLDAMQIAKINYGLDAPQQRIPLEHAITAQLAQGKWEEVDKHFSYFEWLNDEVYQRDFFDYLRGTETLSSMLLKASADTDNPMAVRYLIAAKNLNWRAVSAIEATLGESDARLAPWLYNIVLTHYYQSSLVKRHGMARNTFLNEDDEEVAGWTLVMGGKGFGVAGNILVGIVGALIGGFLFSLIGISVGGLIGSIITATVGAVVLLFLIGAIKKS